MNLQKVRSIPNSQRAGEKMRENGDNLRHRESHSGETHPYNLCHTRGDLYKYKYKREDTYEYKYKI